MNSIREDKGFQDVTIGSDVHRISKQVWRLLFLHNFCCGAMFRFMFMLKQSIQCMVYEFQNKVRCVSKWEKCCSKSC